MYVRLALGSLGLLCFSILGLEFLAGGVVLEEPTPSMIMLIALGVGGAATLWMSSIAHAAKTKAGIGKVFWLLGLVFLNLPVAISYLLLEIFIKKRSGAL